MRAGERSVLSLAIVMSTTLCLLPAPASAQAGSQVLERAIEHHGGDVYEHSVSELNICSRSGCYRVAVRMDGGLYRYRVSGPVSAGHREVEATNDAVAHWHDGVEQELAPGDASRLRDWVMERVYFAFLPYRLNDPSVLHQDLGRETWGGRELHKIKITFWAGSSTDAQDQYLYWFEPASGRLEQFAYSYQGEPGGIRFRRLFNHRRVGGILFFDQENLGLEGDHLSVDAITPEYVEITLRAISTVTLEDIRVEPLGPA